MPRRPRVPCVDGLPGFDRRILVAAKPSYPTTLEVATRAGVSRRGALNALERLEARGLVVRIPGCRQRWKVWESEKSAQNEPESVLEGA